MKGEQILRRSSADVIERWSRFRLPPADLWTRIEGQRLMFTRSGFASKEDMTGRLLPAYDDWYLLGRDEQRVERQQKTLATSSSLELARLMEYDRADVLGRARLFESKSIPAKEAQIKVYPGEGGVCVYVLPPMFITYIGKTGRRMYRQILETNSGRDQAVPTKNHRRRKAKDSGGEA